MFTRVNKRNICCHGLERWNVEALVGGERTSLIVAQDRIFDPHLTEREEGKNRRHFFLEADRGTESIERVSYTGSYYVKKMAGYLASRAAQIPTHRYGMRRFTVLTVTTSERRIETMVRALKKITSGEVLVMFYFTDREMPCHCTP